MVWHAHLLNPRDFLEDCIRYGRTPFWNTGLPLATIDTCINNDNLEYNAGDQAPTYFTETTGLPWNSLEDNTQFVLQCTGCSQSMHVPWTTASSLNSWKGPNPGELETGFADPHFMAICKECQVPCDHDALRAQKFRLDCKALLDNNLPMPGTILDLQGLSLAFLLLMYFIYWHHHMPYRCKRMSAECYFVQADPTHQSLGTALTLIRASFPIVFSKLGLLLPFLTFCTHPGVHTGHPRVQSTVSEPRSRLDSMTKPC